MGFSLDNAMLLSSQSYYYAVILVLLSSYLADKYRTCGWVPCTSALCYEGLFDAGFREIDAISEIPFLLVSQIRSFREMIANYCVL